jgi:hypothetical protein
LKINIPETLCTFNGLFWITTNQWGELEKRSNDFLLRNYYDKIRDIAENVYEKRWTESHDAAVINRKWT